MTRRRARIAAGLAAGLLLAGPGLLGAEVVVAARGAPAPSLPPDIDACVGCDGSRAPLRTVWIGDSTGEGPGGSLYAWYTYWR